MLPAGTTVGRYVVLDQLGEGATGEVYRAWDNTLDRVVALKVLTPLRASNANSRQQFAREARLTARINHPAVAHVYDVGEFDECPFIAMEFVPGRHLRATLTEPIVADRVVFLARQILGGLAEAHRVGIVHRDLKPENIMISGRDQVKLLDFGLAKRIADDVSEVGETSTSGLTGTPRYMAPEQVQGHAIDPRTDIYSLGAVLYEMITGAPAHPGNTLSEILMSVVHRPVASLPADLCPPTLSVVIKRALEKSPDDRYSSADEMFSALALLDSQEEVWLPSPRNQPRVPHPRAVTFTERGREMLSGVRSSTSTAVELLQQAMEIDPEHAPAFALYADACASIFNTNGDPAWFDKAQAALDRAEEIDPLLPDIRVARARMLWTKTFNFPAETALRELRWALRTDPDHVGALRLWVTITGHVGLFEHMEIAIARRQSHGFRDEAILGMASGLFLARDEPERAIDCIMPELRLDPRHEETIFWWTYVQALLAMDRLDEAKDALDLSLARHPEDPLFLSISALFCALRGDPIGAENASKRSESSVRSEVHPHHAFHMLARAESVLGHSETALVWLKRTANEGFPCYPWFATDPFLTNLRATSGGAMFLQELERRHAFFAREFPLDDPATLSFVNTLVSATPRLP